MRSWRSRRVGEPPERDLEVLFELFVRVHLARAGEHRRPLARPGHATPKVLSTTCAASRVRSSAGGDGCGGGVGRIPSPGGGRHDVVGGAEVRGNAAGSNAPGITPWQMASTSPGSRPGVGQRGFHRPRRRWLRSSARTPSCGPTRRRPRSPRRRRCLAHVAGVAPDASPSLVTPSRSRSPITPATRRSSISAGV